LGVFGGRAGPSARDSISEQRAWGRARPPYGSNLGAPQSRCQLRTCGSAFGIASVWPMKDDPRKRRVDRRFLSGQRHEIDYVVRKFARTYPHRTSDDIRRVVEAVRALIAPSESRAYFMLVCDFALRPTR
jgi:hypothetical protein